MKKLIFTGILAFSLFAYANEEVLIEKPEIVAQLNTVQSNLDKVSSSVMACIESGNVHSACLCQNREIIAKFNSSVELLFKDNKELEIYDLVRFKSSDGEWITQSLKSISKQASSGVPTCN